MADDDSPAAARMFARQVGGDIPHNCIVSVEERVLELFIIIAETLPDLGVHDYRLAKVEDLSVLFKGIPR